MTDSFTHLVNWLATIKRALRQHNDAAAAADPFRHPDDLSAVSFTEGEIEAILGGAAASGSAAALAAAEHNARRTP